MYGYQIPKEVLKRMIKDAGADRVSEDAAIELGRILESISEEISDNAKLLANHAGRSTIRSEDVIRSAEMLKYKLPDLTTCSDPKA